MCLILSGMCESKARGACVINICICIHVSIGMLSKQTKGVFFLTLILL